MNLLMENVLGIPFFDPEGLFIAFEGEEPIGFAHAAFGPNRDFSDINHETGVICLIMVVPSCPVQLELKKTLLEKCEEYLLKKGARVIFGGSTRSSASFYSGLYGGSEPLGVYESDTHLLEAYREMNYKVLYRTLRFRQDLRNYRPPFTPKSVAWRRKLNIEYKEYLPKDKWFQACSAAHFTWFESKGFLPNHPEPIARVLVRVSTLMDAFSLNIMTPPIAALVEVQVHPDYEQQGVGTFLIGETIRRLIGESHVNMVETLALESDVPFVQLIRRLGWKEAQRGFVFIKVIEERRKNRNQEQTATRFLEDASTIVH